MEQGRENQDSDISSTRLLSGCDFGRRLSAWQTDILKKTLKKNLLNE